VKKIGEMKKEYFHLLVVKVKCMIRGCRNLASHKVGEQDIKDEQGDVDFMNMRILHELTTYLCEDHFTWLMDREEQYFREDPRFQ
jgi:hypothetical protein